MYYAIKKSFKAVMTVKLGQQFKEGRKTWPKFLLATCLVSRQAAINLPAAVPRFF